MRKYTNFDSWKMKVHNILLGWVSYKNKQYNLDDRLDQQAILLTLIEDYVITFDDSKTENYDFNHIDGLFFKFRGNKYQSFNVKNEGKPNSMQYITVLANLKQTNLIQEIDKNHE